MSAPETPICRNCAFNGHDVCQRPAGVTFDIVNGERERFHTEWCDRERKPASLLERLFKRTRCGPLGLYFQPRSPAPRFPK